MDFSFNTILFASLIIFFAFYTRSLFGFGGALISIPLLAFLFDLKIAVPLEAIFEVALSLLLIRGIWKDINWRILYSLLIGSVLGTILGTYFLQSFANIILLKILGFVIIIFSLNLLFKPDKYLHLPKIFGVFAGIIGGTLGGMFGTSGPPYVLYLVYQIKPKEILRATLIGLFAFDFIFRLGYFVVKGLITQDILSMTFLLTPALIVGTFLGKRHFTVFDEKTYRKLVVILLIVTGFLLILK
ncbi:sulfite exporter TauE/SafE family protein [Candidatus Gottesmanbacteria bacterium]|nr:sulfite exporter TauE/SafE family protein [Candidatus Gottesmanbacteria bacterium]